MVCVVELRKLWLINKIGYIPQCHGIPAIVTRRSISEKSGPRLARTITYMKLDLANIGKKWEMIDHDRC